MPRSTPRLFLIISYVLFDIKRTIYALVLEPKLMLHFGFDSSWCRTKKIYDMYQKMLGIDLWCTHYDVSL